MAAALQFLEEGFNASKGNCRLLRKLCLTRRRVGHHQTDNIMEVIYLKAMVYHDGLACLRA